MNDFEKGDLSPDATSGSYRLVEEIDENAATATYRAIYLPRDQRASRGRRLNSRCASGRFGHRHVFLRAC
jgi:hypothetical protein